MSTASFQSVYEIDDLVKRMVARHSSIDSLADEVVEVVTQLRRTLQKEVDAYPKASNWLVAAADEAKLRLALISPERLN